MVRSNVKIESIIVDNRLERNSTARLNVRWTELKAINFCFDVQNTLLSKNKIEIYIWKDPLNMFEN